MKQQGPKQIVIPEQRFMSCYGCEFLTHKLVHSGRNPKYANNCEHPNFPMKRSIFSGNLHEESDGHIKTPSCCPLLKRDNSNEGHQGGVGRGVMTNFEKTQVEYHGTIK